MKLYIYCILLICISCSSNKKHTSITNIESITFNIDNVEETVNVSSFIDTLDYEIISLEVTENSLIADITNTWLRENKIIIYDKKSKGVFIFNRDGTYYNRILATGQGPGEYPPVLNDVIVTRSHICIFPPVAQKIFLYDFDGKFNKTIDLQGIWGDTFFTFDEIDYHVINNWSDSERGRYHFFQLMSDKHKVKASHPFDESAITNRRGWGLDNYYSIYKNRALVLLSTKDTIYEINSNNDIAPLYYVNILKNRIPRKLAEGDAYIALQRAIDDQYITGVDKIMESSKFIFLTMSNRNVLIYNKKDKAVEAIGDKFIIPSWGDWRFRLDVMTSIEENTLISTIPAQDCITIKEALNSVEFKNKDFELKYKNALNHIKNEEDNPIVFIMKLKD